MPNCPVVSCRMTDRDVVERVAAQFGTAVMAIDKGKYRTEFAATIKGERAVAFMRDIKPLMGRRRQEAIDSALGCYRPPARKLNFDAAEEIRRRAAAGESVASLARSYDVARQTIYPILDCRIYAAPPSRPWRTCASASPTVDIPPWMSLAELHWLAGWIEGEGSFLAPPPSDPRRPRISGVTRDRDTGAKVGCLLRVKPCHENSKRIRSRGWSPTWRTLIRGNPAISMMNALLPLMGNRRREQIAVALSAAKTSPICTRALVSK